MSNRIFARSFINLLQNPMPLTMRAGTNRGSRSVTKRYEQLTKGLALVVASSVLDHHAVVREFPKRHEPDVAA